MYLHRTLVKICRNLILALLLGQSVAVLERQDTDRAKHGAVSIKYQIQFFHFCKLRSIQRKGFDRFHCDAVFIFSDLSQREKFTRRVKDSHANANGERRAELFEIDLTAAAAKLFVKSGECDGIKRREELLGGDQKRETLVLAHFLDFGERV